MAALGALPSNLACRPIDDDDRESAIDCLQRGFPGRERDYWERAFDRLAQRPAIDDLPRYGYALETSEEIVGIVLTIFTRYGSAGEEEIRCNLSSWSVDPAYRPYAAKLILKACSRRNVTYTNVSPAPETWCAGKAFGFHRFSSGQFAFMPALNSARSGGRVVEFSDGSPEAAMLTPSDRELLSEHARLGCLALVCIRRGTAVPFVLRPRRILRGLIPSHQVIYCRSADELGECAGAIGRLLLRRGAFLCLVDANGPLRGLVGRYFGDCGPKYFRGPRPPKPGDLSFTEFAIFDT